jgi:hypothetical protein
LKPRGNLLVELRPVGPRDDRDFGDGRSKAIRRFIVDLVSPPLSGPAADKSTAPSLAQEELTGAPGGAGL